MIGNPESEPMIASIPHSGHRAVPSPSLSHRLILSGLKMVKQKKQPHHSLAHFLSSLLRPLLDLPEQTAQVHRLAERADVNRDLLPPFRQLLG
jgi:hypothetical protein